LRVALWYSRFHSNASNTTKPDKETKKKLYIEPQLKLKPLDLMKKLVVFIVFGLAFLMAMPQAEARKKKKEPESDTLKSSTLSGLKFRSIGPAFTSGRIADFAVNPDNHSEYYVAVASGNIWKTMNNGQTFKPVFDNYGAYSIGCLAMDPNNHNIVWAGTGENNHQRALGYGDGVYKTLDGGKSWKNMGLKESRQIGMIAIDPRDSQTVFVAAEGSAWGPGGQRGLYKTTDGGENWSCVLEISEHTGVNNVIFDPRQPDVMYATSEQRRRHVHTKIGGGPESHVYKSVDGGENWRKIEKGLPDVDKGGMGIAISPADPDVLYLIVEAAEDKGGFYRSTDRGESWAKRSDHNASGQYYNEIYCDPQDVDKVYSMETISKVTTDGGKTWSSLGNNNRHVDDHALWVNPDDTRHFIIGGDGGVYTTYDGGKHYFHISNLPVTQFYRVNVDNEYPFYSVYGGTQDNNSFGGPNQTTHSGGVPKGAWYVTLGGDGFWQAIDPENPDIVYSEYQYGNSVRYDRKSGEAFLIKPQPGKGQLSFRWNWNAPLIISPHHNTRLYVAAEKLFRSDDRGASWKQVSGDLTRGLDRNRWKVMGQYWSYEAVKKDVSTSLYGTIVSLDESPVKEDLVYVGTDDGLIQVTEDMETWRKIASFPGVPEYTYVSDIHASKFDENVIFAAFDNRKRDDFKSYLLKSSDKGRTWESITGNLPEETVHVIEQDFVNPDILFAGTEFGVYVTLDGGKIWTPLKAGIPTIAVRDIAIQEKENDLVLATFGRGFYILDNYAPLREISPEVLEKEAHIFDIPDALMYIQKQNKYGQGSTDYLGKNPPFGATFTYYLKESPKTIKQIRKEKEKKIDAKEHPIPMPTQEDLRAETFEAKPHLIFDIQDSEGRFVRRLTSMASKGINRAVWDLRYESIHPESNDDKEFNPLSDGKGGILAMPGTYSVKISLYQNGKISLLTEPKSFSCKFLENRTLPAENHDELIAFQLKSQELIRSAYGTYQWAKELKQRMQYLRQVLYRTPGTTPEMMVRARDIDRKIDDLLYKFEGREAPASAEENPPAPVPLRARISSLSFARWRSTSAVSQTEQRLYDILKEEFPPVLQDLKALYQNDILKLENELEEMKAPWTPGRIPKWEE
jgi:photosystem II stability/assembly factor-like uncharacterized protein